MRTNWYGPDGSSTLPPNPPPPPPPPRLPPPPAAGAVAGAAVFWFVAMAVWMKTLSPETIGVAVPRPGSFTFQRTFCVSLQFVGGSAPAAVPFASGPRHCGQSASAAASAANNETLANPIDNQ